MRTRARGEPIRDRELAPIRWRKRSFELARLIETRWWNGARGTFDDGSTNAHGAQAWCLWPSPLLKPGDPRIVAQADVLQRDLDDVLVARARSSSAYDAKSTLAIAARLGSDPIRRAAVERSFRALIGEVATPDTGHFGEMYKLVTRAGRTSWEPANDAPHVWEHALVYSTAMELWP
jgi:hypothetical protein